MEKFAISSMLPGIDKPWKRVDLGLLDGKYRVCLVWYKGEYAAHKHDGDEFFLVLQGRVEIRFRTKTVQLAKGEGYLVRRGRPHVSRSKNGAHVLVVEAKGLSTMEVKNLAGLSG